MDANTAELIRRIISSQSLNFFSLKEDEFCMIRREYYNKIIPDGTLIHCNNELYIMLDATWIHLKYCGCFGYCCNPKNNEMK